MISNNLSSPTSAWLALAVAAVTLIGLVLLILMYALGSPMLGMLNDVTIIVAAWLSVALAWSLHPGHAARSPQLAMATLILAAVGASIVTWGSMLSILGRTGFILSGLHMMLGNALIGLWLLSLNRGHPWQQGLVTFGLITGGVMLLGLAVIPGILDRTDSFEASSWITWVGQMGFFGWAILYPIWSFRLWSLLRGG